MKKKQPGSQTTLFGHNVVHLQLFLVLSNMAVGMAVVAVDRVEREDGGEVSGRGKKAVSRGLMLMDVMLECDVDIQHLSCDVLRVG